MSKRICEFLPTLAKMDESSRGAVAQLGERLVRNEEATGSIPVSSTNSYFAIVVVTRAAILGGLLRLPTSAG